MATPRASHAEPRQHRATSIGNIALSSWVGRTERSPIRLNDRLLRCHLRLPCRFRGWLRWGPRAGCGAGQRERAARELTPGCRVRRRFPAAWFASVRVFASSLDRMCWERLVSRPCGPFRVACGQPGHQPPPSAGLRLPEAKETSAGEIGGCRGHAVPVRSVWSAGFTGATGRGTACVHPGYGRICSAAKTPSSRTWTGTRRTAGTLAGRRCG